MLERRQLLTAIGGLVGGVVSGAVLPREVWAQQGIVTLTDRLTLVTTGRTNVLAHSVGDGLVLVDSGAPDLTVPVTAALRPLAGRTLTLFNTHFHTEHTGGNETFRQAGATIVAHENTRLWMATPTWLPAEDRYRPPRPKDAQPTKTFYTEGSMQVGGERIDYGYLIEAHTSGDIYVFFRDSNVLAVGDVASPARDPELDYLTGAWIGGRADALGTLVALANADTKIVPGVGPVMTRAELQAERDMMKTIYDRTVDRVREGDSARDMFDAGVLKGLPRTFRDPHSFLYDLQKGLWAHHNKLSPNVV
jgi:glyoxylase-like metal-dependent hydrolase (beta-lactamase superfamily II)